LEQEDFGKFLEKRWKRYKAEQKRRKVMEGAIIGALRAAGGMAELLRKMRLIKQGRRERIAVE
jgi:hypothetical protein